MSNYNDTSKLPICDKHRHEVINHALREEVIPLTVGMKLEQTVETLRNELAEAKAELHDTAMELSRCQTMLPYDYAFENGIRSVQSKLDELAEFKRQIAAGELVTIKFLMEHYTKYCGESEAKHHVVIMQKLSVEQAGKDAK